ncbi:MAG: response regulator [Pseudotabrizicola sp.]|nr:response regulator [Pseudotabrizicola sp.]
MMKILAVDDTPFILELIPMLAAKAGFPEVTTCSSASDALKILAQDGLEFDCLLLDVNMPGMDGIELCSRIRQLEKHQKTPIIMLTAMHESEFLDRAFKAGATDYATKPFDIKELGARLRMAQELVVARREALTAIASATEKQQDSATKDMLDLGHPTSFQGVENFIDINALKNYLTQSSRAGLAASQVIGVKIDWVERIQSKALPEEMGHALRDIADAINEVLRTNLSFLSYAGNGTFIALSNSAALLSSSEIEAEVQYVLDEKNTEYDNGDPMDIEISIGNPIRPDCNDIAEVPRSIIRAVARAESRSIAKRDAKPTINIRHG